MKKVALINLQRHDVSDSKVATPSDDAQDSQSLWKLFQSSTPPFKTILQKNCIAMPNKYGKERDFEKQFTAVLVRTLRCK